MKRRDHRLGDAQSAHQLLDALAHLRCRLVGKGHGQDGLRHHALVLDQIGDAVGDYARFAAARASQNQYWPFGGFDGLTLLRV